MKKVLIIGITLFCLILAGADNADSITALEQLKMKLAGDQIDFPDSILNNLLAMSYNLVVSHGLACKLELVTYGATGQARVDLGGNCDKVLFVSSVRLGGTGNLRSLPEIKAKDLARKHIKTAATSPQFFVFYRDIVSGVKCGYIYLYPAPAHLETLQVTYYVGHAISNMNLAFEDLVVDFGLFFAYVREREWQDVADIYNDAIRRLVKLRQLFINREPDITIMPKEIE